MAGTAPSWSSWDAGLGGFGPGRPEVGDGGEQRPLRLDGLALGADLGAVPLEHADAVGEGGQALGGALGVGQEGPGLDQLAAQPLDPVLVRAAPARLEQRVPLGGQLGEGGLGGAAGADDPGGEHPVADLLVRQGPQLGQLVDVDGEDALVQVLGGAAEQVGQLAVLDGPVGAGDAQRRARGRRGGR